MFSAQIIPQVFQAERQACHMVPKGHRRYEREGRRIQAVLLHRHGDARREVRGGLQGKVPTRVRLPGRQSVHGAGGLPGQEQGETRLRLQRLPRRDQHGKSRHQGMRSRPLHRGVHGTHAQHFALPENYVRVWNQA